MASSPENLALRYRTSRVGVPRHWRRTLIWAAVTLLAVFTIIWLVESALPPCAWGCSVAPHW